ncbi:fimbrial protein [Gibbsiella quercinecans]|uniref:fimbrial protein n=1 Tax=Gibbsiella quercinecans TaxID=929813 RepID=UPI000EF15E7F|nr:fimbrial protein [Gibbsiella quercinecans]RLM11885.1 ferrous iron transporter B [Gibbsiella quercinecans]
MKISKLSAVLALAVSAATVSSFSAQAADGTITFNGKVTDQTCTISTPGGKDFTVTLPTVSSSTLASQSATAGRTPFSINLTQCSKGQVATYFEPGATVDFNTGRLNNQAQTDAATNVQIQLLGSNNQFLPILAAGSNGAQANSQWVAVANDGDSADLNYYAEYYATGAAGAGDVTSNVQYTIIYQ